MVHELRSPYKSAGLPVYQFKQSELRHFYRGRGGYDDMRRGGYEDRGAYNDRGPAHRDNRDRHGGYQDRSDYGPRGGYGNRGDFPDRRGPADIGLSDRRHTNSGASSSQHICRWLILQDYKPRIDIPAHKFFHANLYVAD